MAGYRVIGGGSSGGGGGGTGFTDSFTLGIKATDTNRSSTDRPTTPDSSSFGADGIVHCVGVPPIVASPFSGFSNAFQTDGLVLIDGNNIAAVNMGADLQLPNGPFSIDCRVKFNSVEISTAFLARWVNSSLGLHFWWGMGSSINMRVRILDGGGTERIFDGTVSPPFNTTSLYAMAVDYDGTTLRAWLKDGASASVKIIEQPVAGVSLGSFLVDKPFWIGRDGYDATAYNISNAKFDEVRFSNISRYASSFAPGTTPFVNDANTLRLYHLDTVTDTSPKFAIALAQSDTNAAQSEAVQLKFPAGVWSESSPAPTDSRSALLRVWLAGSAGTDVATPANANGQNDGATAVVSTAVLASNPETMTSNVGASIGAGLTFTSLLYRGWFRAQTTLVTSTAEIIAHSSTAAFTDIVMFTQSTLNGDTNNLAGGFTFDLLAAGVNTLAKLQSLQILHRTTDLAAGVTPAILTVDAGAADIVATSI